MRRDRSQQRDGSLSEETDNHETMFKNSPAQTDLQRAEWYRSDH
jgi:hypothetical protein